MTMMGTGYDSLLLMISLFFLPVMQPGPAIYRTRISLEELLRPHTVLMKCQEMSVLGFRTLDDIPIKTTSPCSKEQRANYNVPVGRWILREYGQS